MSNYIESLPDGWTIYLWLVIGAMIILSVVYWIHWGAKNEQFDEDIKYVIFTEDDKDKMDPAEYAKSREVIKAQMESRIRFKAKEEAERKKKEA
jgi:cbb3-type cytochrome oxidase subunit 3